MFELTGQTTDASYEIANGILKDAGVSKNSISTVEYAKIINAIRDGNFDITIGKNESGKVVIGGESAPVDCSKSDKPYQCQTKKIFDMYKDVIYNPGDALNTLGGAWKDAASGAVDELTQGIWLRAGMGVLGGLVIIVGIFMLAPRAATTVLPVGKVAKLAGAAIAAKG